VTKIEEKEDRRITVKPKSAYDYVGRPNNFIALRAADIIRTAH